MIRMGEVENGIAKNNLQFSVLTREHAGEGVITGFYKHSVPGPLPELSLGSPKLRSVVADHQRIAFSFLSFSRLDLFCVHD